MIYLICGVPASGKTWVIKQLIKSNHFAHIPHDEYDRPQIISIAKTMSRIESRPILIDCPFAERLLREELEGVGLKVIPIFIIEHPKTIRDRYYKREKKPIAQGCITRISSNLQRAKEWEAFHGTSEEVLKHMKDLV